MKLQKWQSNEQMTRWAASTFNTKEGREFLAMLEESHIRHAVRTDLGNPTQNLTDLGRIYGYDQAVNNIVAAAQYIKPIAPLVENWGVESPATPQKKR